MIKVILLDDDKEAIERLKNYIVQKSNNFDVTVFHDVKSCEKYLEKEEVDVAFFDIKIQEELSLPLVDRLSRRSIVVFISDYPRYSLECHGYRTLAFIEKKKLDQKIQPILEEIEQIFKEKTTLFCTYKQQDIYLKDVVYLIKEGNYVSLTYFDGKTYQEIKLRKTMYELENLLESGFIKVDRGIIINYEYIRAYTKEELRMKNEKRILITTGYQKDVLKRFSLLKATRNFKH